MYRVGLECVIEILVVVLSPPPGLITWVFGVSAQLLKLCSAIGTPLLEPLLSHRHSTLLATAYIVCTGYPKCSIRTTRHKASDSGRW